MNKYKIIDKNGNTIDKVSGTEVKANQNSGAYPYEIYNGTDLIAIIPSGYLLIKSKEVK